MEGGWRKNGVHNRKWRTFIVMAALFLLFHLFIFLPFYSNKPRRKQPSDCPPPLSSSMHHSANSSWVRLPSRIAVKEARDTNFVSSALTFRGALAMLAIGSTGGTARELLSFLNSESSEALNSLSQIFSKSLLADGSTVGGPSISTASGIWVDESMPLKPNYAQTVKGVYAAEAKSVDFRNKIWVEFSDREVEDEVNSWAEHNTNGLIKQLIPSDSIGSATRLVLANALYFKGVWEEGFDQSLTRDDSFYPLKGQPVRVPFMSSKEERQFVAAFPGLKVLKMPYKRGSPTEFCRDRRSFAMYFFLPDERKGLHGLLDMVDSNPEFLNKHLPPNKAKIGRFMIPKFKIGYGIEASEVLKQMGLVSIFPPAQGEFTETVDSPFATELSVGKIFHKSFVEVNEEGTEAASATAVTMFLSATMGPPRYVDFVADHPFLFLIREETTGVVVCVGHVINPTIQP